MYRYKMMTLNILLLYHTCFVVCGVFGVFCGLWSWSVSVYTVCRCKIHTRYEVRTRGSVAVEGMNVCTTGIYFLDRVFDSAKCQLLKHDF
jgi:hypothetical protein